MEEPRRHASSGHGWVAAAAVVAALLPGLDGLAVAQTEAADAAPASPRVTHHIVEAAGVRWHYVEAGEGEPVVFLHGLPESWFSWHHQIDSVSPGYRAIAVDLKGYGQSDTRDGDYTAEGVARELLGLLDEIGVARFALVTHDWGTLIGDHVAAAVPDRIVAYVRMQAPLLQIDPRNHPQFELFRNQELATRMMADARGFVERVCGARTVQPIPEEDLEGVVREFGRPGVAEAVPRYFRDMQPEAPEVRAARFARMSFPVLLLQGERDPAQPLSYFSDFESVLPGARLVIVRGAGHFTELEQPRAVSDAILGFLGEVMQASAPGTG